MKSSLIILVAVLGAAVVSAQNPMAAFDPLVDAGKMTFSCLTTLNSSWTDKYIGQMPLDEANYCNSACLRAVPGISCCRPQSPEKLRVAFRMSSPSSPTVERSLSWDDINAEPSPSGKVAIIIHGFMETPDSSAWMKRTRDAYLKLDYTTIMVDWRHGNQVNYFQSYTNVRTIGAMAGKVIVNWGAASRTRLIGFSLGGQTVGEAGRFVKATGALVKECHALDPAGPWFTGCPQMAIQKDDCALTEVIHSSAEPIQNVGVLTRNFGTRTKSGHCDYWINCGFDQGPGCTNIQLAELIKSTASLATMSSSELKDWFSHKVSCAHSRSPMVYVAQLEGQCAFAVQECPDCGNGPKCTPGSAPGIQLPPMSQCSADMNVDYYVKSGDASPYCQ